MDIYLKLRNMWDELVKIDPDVDIGKGGWYGEGGGGGNSDHRGDGDPLWGEHNTHSGSAENV